MQKSKFITIAIILVIIMYLLISQFQLMKYGIIYSYIINPLFFICTALFLKFFITPPYSTNKFKNDIIQYVLITILIYALIYMLSGLFVNFGTNPYASNFRGLVFNLYSTGLVIFCREYIRYKLIHNVYNKDRKIIFVLLVIVFSLVELNMPSILSSKAFYSIFKLLFYTLIPTIIKNILFTFMVSHTDYIPSFLYELIYNLILWIPPILPTPPWVFEAILNSVFPLMLLLYVNYFVHKKDRFHLNTVSVPTNPSGLVPFGIILVLLIWFALGIFPIKPVGVATASMLPELKVGDLAIIKKCTPNDIKVQDVIEYQMEGYTVIHRVVKINQKNGEFIFTTKGDNNDSEDARPVREDQLIGKVIYKIPYVALPTIWLHNLRAQTNVEVETGV